jgi:DNA polymerase-3 subunit alpha
LNDFAHRTDLRQVGKRALESLVKVGALDGFGPRIALLEALDRIVSVSSSHFRAAEAGQLSLFGGDSGITEEITLPKTTAEVSRREVLNWERELIGLYVSDHPLSPVMNDLAETVTHFSAQLSEANPNERVRVAGLITRVRHHQSKAGKPMGFVTIEDLQGTIDLVVFPKTWEKQGGMIEFDKIIIVEGRVDAGDSAEPKVLVDNISTDFTRFVSVDSPSTAKAQLHAPAVQAGPAHRVHEDLISQSQDVPEANTDWDDSDVPPPPDAFSPDWEGFADGGSGLGAIAAAVFASGPPEPVTEVPLSASASTPLTAPVELSHTPGDEIPEVDAPGVEALAPALVESTPLDETPSTGPPVEPSPLPPGPEASTTSPAGGVPEILPTADLTTSPSYLVPR